MGQLSFIGCLVLLSIFHKPLIGQSLCFAQFRLKVSNHFHSFLFLRCNIAAARKLVNSDTGNLYRQTAHNQFGKQEWSVNGVLPPPGPDGSAWGYSGRVEWLETQINRAKCQSTQYCFVTQVINSHIIPSPFKHPTLITWQILQELFTSRENCEQINKAYEGWSHGKGSVDGGGAKVHVTSHSESNITNWHHTIHHHCTKSSKLKHDTFTLTNTIMESKHHFTIITCSEVPCREFYGGERSGRTKGWSIIMGSHRMCEGLVWK